MLVNLEAKLGLDACALDHAGEASGPERRTAFRCEHEGGLWLLIARPQLITNDGVGAGRTLLDDTRLIQDWLGHRAIQHTARYTELSPTRFKDVWR